MTFPNYLSTAALVGLQGSAMLSLLHVTSFGLRAELLAENAQLLYKTAVWAFHKAAAHHSSDRVHEGHRVEAQIP